MENQPVQEILTETEEVVIPWTIRVRTKSGEEAIYDRIDFGVQLRENYRSELQKELREIVARESGVATPGLIKYKGLEKEQEGMFLVRNTPEGEDVVPFEPENLIDGCRAILQLLTVIQHYHNTGLVCGGVSTALLKQDASGRVWIQDPLVLSHLNNLLDSSYRFSIPSEVIAGGPWSEAADVFSWGETAYRLLAGADPFCARSKEERIDKIIRGEVLEPRLREPRMTGDLAALIVSCLAKTPETRPSINDVIVKLQMLVQENKVEVTLEEADSFRLAAESRLKQQDRRDRYRRWWKKYGLIATGAVGVILAVIGITVATAPKKVITAETTPRQVLDYYFTSIKTLNPSLFDETVRKKKNSLEDLVVNLYVLNRQQQGMTQQFGDFFKVSFPELVIVTETEDVTVAKYTVSYLIKVEMARSIQYLQRKDIFILKPWRKIWRIEEITILASKQWEEENPNFKDPGMLQVEGEIE